MEGVTMNDRVYHSNPARLGLRGLIVVSGLSLVGCPKPVPRVPIPGSDASLPTMAWQTYNLQQQARGEIVNDGQSIEVPASDLYVVTLAVEALDSGVTDVTLS